MAKRKIIKIDEELCTGCGVCVPNCMEGALQIIDGKARLVSDLFCDGLGACIGHCPKGAIEIEEREAEAYDERAVMKTIIPKGQNTIKAHLEHLRDHGADDFLKEAVAYLKELKIKNPTEDEITTDAIGKCNTHGHGHHEHHGGCPGSKIIQFDKDEANEERKTENRQSELKQWPVQMHLITPSAPYYKGADVLLCADCVAFTVGDFHTNHLKGKALAIACPKLDSQKEVYVDKITRMINEAKINTLTVMMMEVPCCGGLLRLAKEAISKADRKVPVKKIIIGIKGDVISEEWV